MARRSACSKVPEQGKEPCIYYAEGGHVLDRIAFSKDHLDRSFLFWYNGHKLVLHCDIKEHREDLRISSISLNTKILKSLIEECREKYIKDT